MYKKFNSFMISHEYTKIDVNHCVYVKQFSNIIFIILLLYVNDMLIVGHDTKMIDDLKMDLSKAFDTRSKLYKVNSRNVDFVTLKN